MTSQTLVHEDLNEWHREQRQRIKGDLVTKASYIATSLGEASRQQRGLTFDTHRYKDPPISIIVKDYNGEKSVQVIFHGECVLLEENSEIKTYKPADDWENKIREIYYLSYR